MLFFSFKVVKQSFPARIIDRVIQRTLLKRVTVSVIMKNRKPKYISKIGVDKPKNGSQRKWAKLIPKKVFFNYLKKRE